MVHAPIRPVQVAEWLPARTVLLCEPNIETLFGLLQTASNNFPYPYALASGRAEHRAYRHTLEQAGVRVIDVREALAAAPRARLEDWARQAVRIEHDAVMSEAERGDSQAQLDAALCVFDADSLADLIMLRPLLRVSGNARAVDPTTRFSTRYEVRPAESAYYTRDPVITTARGCVVTRLKLDIREPENEVMAHVLEALGITPLHRIEAPGTLEGGDFIPCGEYVLQGRGLLTNEEGVRQCLDRRVYGFVEVAVVQDPRNNMDEMHLDTYFAMLDKDLAACCDTRLSGNEEPIVQVWEPAGTPESFVYRHTRTLLFSAYLKEKGVTVIPFSKTEQDNFAANGLLIGPRRLIGVTRAGADYEQRLRAAGVDTCFIQFDALTGGYGGPHCSSQVLERGTRA
jgi:arginine deiminase